MVNKVLLNKLYSAKCQYDENGFCHSFEDITEEERIELMSKVAEEIYGIKLIVFQTFKRYKGTMNGFTWEHFVYGNNKRYIEFLKDTGIEDMRKRSDFLSSKDAFLYGRNHLEPAISIQSFYYPCVNNKDCIGYLLVPEDGTIDFDTPTAKTIAHELSHLILSGNLSQKTDFGYNGYLDSQFGDISDKENVLESLAIVYTYIFGSFFGLFNYSINRFLGKDFSLLGDEYHLLMILRIIRSLDLVDDNMRPNFMISFKTLEQVRYEIDNYINS